MVLKERRRPGSRTTAPFERIARRCENTAINFRSFAALRTVIDTERLAGLSPYHAIRNTINA